MKRIGIVTLVAVLLGSFLAAGAGFRQQQWKKVEEAKNILTFARKYAADPVKKVLLSALANAKQNPNIDETILYVKEIFVDQGPSLKRWRARAQGRAASIKKRMSHITVVLDEQ